MAIKRMVSFSNYSIIRTETCY